MTDADNLDHGGADARLKALFAQDEPPARDPMFSTAVMARVARRQFLQDVAFHTGVTVLGGLVLWAVWPSLQPLIAALGQDMAPVAACLTLAAIAIILVGGRPGAALGFEHD